MTACGLSKSKGQEISGALDATVIGMDVCKGRSLAPNIGTCVHMWSSIEYMATMPAVLRVSSWQLAALLGTAQWHCLLRRPVFAIFHAVYNFVRSEPQGVEVFLDDAVVPEPLLCGSLSPLLEADVARTWSADLIATDASPAFGFGVSVLKVGAERMRRR